MTKSVTKTFREDLIRHIADALTDEYPDGDATEHDFVGFMAVDALVEWLRSHQLETITYRHDGSLRRCDLGRVPSEELADLLEANE